jgi:adenylate cyclase
MKKNSRPKTTNLRRLLLIGTAVLLLLLELIALLPKLTTPLERVELSMRDTLMHIRGKRPPSGQIVIVAVDDASFTQTEYQWPWPRSYLAKIVNQVNADGAHLVGLDILLFEEGYDVGGDDALAAALKESPHSVSVMQIYTPPGKTSPTLELPLPAYGNTLGGVGITEVTADEDAIVRGLHAYRKYEQVTYYNWAFVTAALALGVDPPFIQNATTLVFDGKTVPLSGGKLLVNFAGPAGTYPTHSAADVAEGLVDPSVFRDKIVLIGATTLTLHDVFPTPFSASEQTPGVEIIANAIDTILSGNYLRVAPPWVNLLLIVVMAVLAWVISRTRRPALTIILMSIGMIAYAVIVYFAFANERLYLPLTSPELMLFLGVVLPTLEQAVSQELEKRRVRGMFTRFISPEMVDQLLATRDINSLNKRANLTIFFSDIRGFTTLSEKLTPDKVIALLNPYLEVMTDVIHKHGGTVDKYVGDAIVAFFGEPVPYADHALRAARAALDMRAALVELKERWRTEGILPERFEIGIGLNSGDAFVGLLGSAQRINYTIIGDNVNLASRLQELTKTYAWPIIISEATANAIKDEFDVEFIEATTIRGKTEPVKIFKVLGRRGGERIGPLFG